MDNHFAYGGSEFLQKLPTQKNCRQQRKIAYDKNLACRLRWINTEAKKVTGLKLNDWNVRWPDLSACLRLESESSTGTHALRAK
jgi:hypothetical protein